jgi:hypothetical protein
MPEGQHALAITDDEYMACLRSSPLPHTVVDELLTPPTQAAIDAYYARDAWAELQHNARVALFNSDIIVLRCYENGVPVPADWKEYRAALRVIVSAASGDATAGLPVMPAWPAG